MLDRIGKKRARRRKRKEKAHSKYMGNLRKIAHKRREAIAAELSQQSKSTFVRGSWQPDNTASTEDVGPVLDTRRDFDVTAWKPPDDQHE